MKFDFEKQFNILSYSPISIKSSFDDNLNLVIANSEIAEQFRSTPKILLTDTTGNWINYNANYLKIGTAVDGLFGYQSRSRKLWD